MNVMRRSRLAFAGALVLAALGFSAGPASADSFMFASGYDVVNDGDTCTTSCQLGRDGSAGGQLSLPTSLASSGNEVFVTEGFNNRVSVFDASTNKFVRAFGSGVGGGGKDTCTTLCFAGFSGQTAAIGLPAAVTVSGGEAFVTDGPRRRIAVFNATTGAFLRGLAKDIGGVGTNVCTTNCNGGPPPGTGAGEVTDVGGVAVAGNEVFVLDSGNRRVVVFDKTSGAFVRAFGKNVGGAGDDVCDPGDLPCQAGTVGFGAGQVDTPVSIVATGGEVFVAERGNARVSVWNTAGVFQRAFGKDVGGAGDNVCDPGDLPCAQGAMTDVAGAIAAPSQLTVSGGQLFITDPPYFRVSVFDPSGSFVRAIGRDVGGNGVNTCAGICQTGAPEPGTVLNTGQGVAVVNGQLWISELDPLFAPNQRILVRNATTGALLRMFGKSVRPGGNGEAEHCRAACEAGRPGDGAGHLKTPQGVAASGGETFVADTLNDRIAVFDGVSGVFKRAFGDDVGGTGSGTCTTSCAAGTAGDDADQFEEPRALAFSGGRVFVADTGNHRVTSFNAATGAPVRGYGKGVGGAFDTCEGLCQAGLPGAGAAALDEITGVAADAGRLFVSERENNRVSVFDVATGAFIRAFGKDVGGAGDDACDPADLPCQRGTAGTGSGGLDQPSGVAAAGGEVFVSERRNRRVSVFDAATGAFKRAFGKEVGGVGADTCTSSCREGRAGTGPGRLDVPLAISVASGSVFVTDSKGNRVSVFNAASGAFIRAVGANVGGSGIDTCTSSCQPATNGSGSGSLNNPTGVAASGSMFYVADTDNNRLAAFSTDVVAPVTTDDVPAAGQRAPVPVTLTAIDSGGSGVARTYFTTGSSPAPPTTSSPVYSAANKPVLAPGERIRYFSVDNAGNQEVARTSGAVVAAPPLKPTPKLKIAKAALATALSKGLVVSLTGFTPGRRVALVARKGRTRVASGAGKAKANGTLKVRVKFTRAAKRSLRKARTVKLTISGGGAKATITLRGKK